MSTAAPVVNESAFRRELVAHGHFLPSGEPGVYGRGATFEDVRTRLDTLITRACELDRPETPRFPPIIPRRTCPCSMSCGTIALTVSTGTAKPIPAFAPDGE